MKIADPQRYQPIRTCAGCFQRFPQTSLIAMTRLKNNAVVLNLTTRIAGRSVYLCPQLKCFHKATKRKGKNAFEYSLKVKIPEKIIVELENYVTKNPKSQSSST